MRHPTMISRITAFMLIVLLISCSKDDAPQDMDPPGTGERLDIIVDDDLRVNPSGYAPLSAIITVETEEPVSVHMKVAGREGVRSDVIHEFQGLATSHSIPVHGLYAGSNSVELTFFDGSGLDLGTQVYAVETTMLISDLPQITIQEAQHDEMEAGMTLVSYYGHAGSMFPQRPFIFDSYGKIRWYLDYSTHPELNTLFYDDGMERLANGNFYFGNNNTATIYEIDMFGSILNSWDMPGYDFHHEVTEKPDGNFLVTVSKRNLSTVEDHIIEIHRESGDILREWDLNESLDNTRQTFTDDVSDWIHVNAITYDPGDDTIIITGRTQGTIKLTMDNEVVWIISPHTGWDSSGNGTDLTQALLQPLDAAGEPIVEPGLIDGTENHPDFEWNWYPHAPMVMPNGNIMLFDNGDNRNFVGNTYSRAVEYRIDAQSKTIRQVWEYGKDRGAATYSRIVSDVDYLPASDHVLFSPGAVAFNGGNYGKSIEVDYTSGNIIYEATITPPIAVFQITFHRTERLPLYPAD